MIEKVIEVNRRISEVGAAGNFELNIGHNIRRAQKAGYMSNDIVANAMADTASGVNARMAGVNVPVVTNSGSGNQGITTTVPILSASKSLDIDEDRTFRAVTLSNLMAIHIHSRFFALKSLWSDYCRNRRILRPCISTGRYCRAGGLRHQQYVK